MASRFDEIRWDRFPRVHGTPEGKKWLEIQHMLGLAANTVEAYGRGLEGFLCWCERTEVDAVGANRGVLASYVGDLRSRPGPRGKGVVALDSGAGLSNATMQQRLTAIRLFFDFLIEEGQRDTNPVGRGRYTAGKGFACKGERGLLARRKRLPWLPSDEEWRRLLDEARQEGIRNRCMLALAYDAALRREELCGLESGDVQPAHRLLRVRAETSKSRQDRVLPYSETTGVLLAAYLARRRDLSRKRGPLFLSESRRNRAEPPLQQSDRCTSSSPKPWPSTASSSHHCLSRIPRGMGRTSASTKVSPPPGPSGSSGGAALPRWKAGTTSGSTSTSSAAGSVSTTQKSSPPSSGRATSAPSMSPPCVACRSATTPPAGLTTHAAASSCHPGQWRQSSPPHGPSSGTVKSGAGSLAFRYSASRATHSAKNRGPRESPPASGAPCAGGGAVSTGLLRAPLPLPLPDSVARIGHGHGHGPDGRRSGRFPGGEAPDRNASGTTPSGEERRRRRSIKAGIRS